MRFRRKREKEIDPFKRGIFEPRRYYELLRKAVTDPETANRRSKRVLELSPACLRNLHHLCNGTAEASFGEDAPECRCLCHADEL